MGKTKWIVLIAALALVGYFIWASAAPSYPDILTPKPDFGNPESDIRIEEFSDLQCPACGSAQTTVERLLEDYGDVISFKYYHFPLRSIHPQAQLAAEAAECANDQGAMEDYISLAFANQQSLSRDDLKSYAQALGLDSSFNDCLDSGAKRSLVDADFRVGVQRGVDSTPTFFLNGVKVQDRSYEALSARIEAMLE